MLPSPPALPPRSPQPAPRAGVSHEVTGPRGAASGPLPAALSPQQAKQRFSDLAQQTLALPLETHITPRADLRLFGDLKFNPHFLKTSLLPEGQPNQINAHSVGGGTLAAQAPKNTDSYMMAFGASLIEQKIGLVVDLSSAADKISRHIPNYNQPATQSQWKGSGAGAGSSASTLAIHNTALPVTGPLADSAVSTTMTLNLASGGKNQPHSLTSLNMPALNHPTDALKNLGHLVDYMADWRQKNPDCGVLVHCSAGVGRTGLLLAAETLKKLSDQGTLSPHNLDQHLNQSITDLRSARSGNMVQTAGQFKTLHDYGLQLLAQNPAGAAPEPRARAGQPAGTGSGVPPDTGGLPGLTRRAAIRRPKTESAENASAQSPASSPTRSPGGPPAISPRLNRATPQAPPAPAKALSEQQVSQAFAGLKQKTPAPTESGFRAAPGPIARYKDIAFKPDFLQTRLLTPGQMKTTNAHQVSPGHIAAQAPKSNDGYMLAFGATLIEHKVGLVLDLTTPEDKTNRQIPTYNKANIHSSWSTAQNGGPGDALKIRNQPHALSGPVADTATASQMQLELKGPGGTHRHQLVALNHPITDHESGSVQNLANLVDHLAGWRHQNPDSNMLIHCSAGVGRTGMVLVAQEMKKMASAGELTPDGLMQQIGEQVLALRAARSDIMVQTPAQLKALHAYGQHLLAAPPAKPAARSGAMPGAPSSAAAKPEAPPRPPRELSPAQAYFQAATAALGPARRALIPPPIPARPQ